MTSKPTSSIISSSLLCWLSVPTHYCLTGIAFSPSTLAYPSILLPSIIRTRTGAKSFLLRALYIQHLAPCLMSYSNNNHAGARILSRYHFRGWSHSGIFSSVPVGVRAKALLLLPATEDGKYRCHEGIPLTPFWWQLKREASGFLRLSNQQTPA